MTCGATCPIPSVGGRTLSRRAYRTPGFGLRYAALLLVLALPGCGSTPEQEPPAELSPFEPQARIARLWGDSVGDDEEFDLTNLRPFAHGETVYAVDAGGAVTAYALKNGDRLWRHDLDRTISSGVGGDGERLWVTTRDGDLLALSAKNGKLLWSADVASEVITVPVVGQGKVIVRGVDGRVSVFDAVAGGALWEYRSNVPVLSLRGVGEPLINGSVVFAGLDNGRVVALNLNDGTVIWEQTISAPRGRSEVERLVDVDSAPVVDGDALYVGGYQGRIVLLAAGTGTTRWSRDMSTNKPLALDRNSVFVADEEGMVWALERNTGSALWKQDRLQRRRLTGTVVHAEYLAVGDFEGHVHWLSRTDGRLVARRQVHDTAISNAPLVYRDLLLVQSRGGYLAALRILPLGEVEYPAN